MPLSITYLWGSIIGLQERWHLLFHRWRSWYLSEGVFTNSRGWPSSHVYFIREGHQISPEEAEFCRELSRFWGRTSHEFPPCIPQTHCGQVFWELSSAASFHGRIRGGRELGGRDWGRPLVVYTSDLAALELGPLPRYQSPTDRTSLAATSMQSQTGEGWVLILRLPTGICPSEHIRSDRPQSP